MDGFSPLTLHVPLFLLEKSFVNTTLLSKTNDNYHIYSKVAKAFILMVGTRGKCVSELFAYHYSEVEATKRNAEYYYWRRKKHDHYLRIA